MARTFLVLVLTTVAALAVVATPGARTPHVDHVVLIVFENKERGAVVGSPSAPTFNRLAARYAQATDYRAVAHPSLPNYLALVSGSTHGVADNCTDCPQTGPTIGSKLSAAGKTWATYAEGYPTSTRFAMKHVPFLYFPGGVAHVHALSALHATALPAFSLVIPDMCSDMHDCAVASGDRFLKRLITPLLAQPSTIVFITFDEGVSDLGGGGRVALIAAGASVAPHSKVTAPVNHYGLLRTIAEQLGVQPPGAARGARPLSGIWR
jgi:hypothetical protein